MNNFLKVQLTDEDLAKINGGTEVIVMTDGGDEGKVVPPGVLTHNDFSPRGGKNTPGGNEDIWQRK